MIVPATGALGFEEHAVFRDEAGRIVHAQLVQNGGMVMLGPEEDTPFAAFMVAPRDVGLRETTTCYVVVADVAAHHARAVAGGAEIIMPLEAQDYGGANYSVRDPEGHIWSFGDYDPFAGRA